MALFQKYRLHGKARFAAEVALLFLLFQALFGCASSPDRTSPPQISEDIPEKVRVQIERLYSPDPKDRAAAAMRLRKMGLQSLPAIPYLVDLLGDETVIYISRGSFRVVSIKTSPGKEAAMALSSLGRAAVEPVIGRLFDSDPDVRENAAWSLGMIGDRRAVAPLEELVNDPDEKVRQVAEWALARIRKGVPQRGPHGEQLI